MMKKYTVLLFLIALCAAGRAAEVHNINHGWKFFNASRGSSDDAVLVNLPHTWNTDALGVNRDYLREVGNYLKQIDIPAGWNGRRVYLRLYGANALCNVIVNGRHAGQHRGGYTAFTVEITDLLRFGQTNAFWVMVNNSSQPDILPTAGDQNVYGGLVRDAELIVTNPVSLARTDYSSNGVYITSRKNTQGGYTMETTVKLTARTDRNVQVSVALIDRAGVQVARQEDRVKVTAKALASLTIPLTVASPRLWDGVADPYLYDVCVKVSEDQTVHDSVVVKTGLRDYGFDKQRGFMLNGKPYRLHGVTVTQDRPVAGTALQPWHVEEDVALIREMGANLAVMKGPPHHPLFYDLCDRAGIMVVSELPLMGAAYLTDRAWFDTPAFRQNGRDQLTEIIRQQFNHPSIIAWGIFDCLDQRGDNPLGYVRDLNTLAKKEDPSRYTAAVSNEDGQINFVTDLITWRHSFGWSEGAPSDISVWLGYLHSTWGKLSSAVSYGAGASIEHQSDSLHRPIPASTWHPERWQTHLHEEYFKYLRADSLLWATLADNMFDYGAAGRRGGDGLGINDMGLVSFDRKYRKDAFYFYKANWNPSEAFVYIAERRWAERDKPVQQIRVFSNCGQVELLVNGVSQGAAGGVNGTFVWPAVTLRPGRNEIEARCGQLADKAEIRIVPGLIR